MQRISLEEIVLQTKVSRNNLRADTNNKIDFLLNLSPQET